MLTVHFNNASCIFHCTLFVVCVLVCSSPCFRVAILQLCNNSNVKVAASWCTRLSCVRVYGNKCTLFVLSDAVFIVMCFYSKELREPMLKAYELRSECDKLEKLCKFLQERLDEASAYYIFLIHI